ncbi:MAG: Zn-ribbon domain-containing OB-fold protein [Chloroflexi bacterium]|nr:Zn-ribbon domain-containing OB-fold protein [Chloroflexota bacterium]MCI0842098.1 Zn-ribbon domain-containing OB-fold protein [Chloroflexota bacterium]
MASSSDSSVTQYAGPLPQPTPETQPFFDGLRERRLMVQRCGACGQAYYYPRPICPHCNSNDVHWFEASGKGSVYSFVISHRSRPGFEAPYVIAVVELDEGPRMMTNLVGVEPDPEVLRCDMPVEIVYEDVTSDMTLPRFKPVVQA